MVSPRTKHFRSIDDLHIVVRWVVRRDNHVRVRTGNAIRALRQKINSQQRSEIDVIADMEP